MEYDVAIIYFGLTRTTKKVYESHINNIFNQFKQYNTTYKIFMHTWKTNDNKQRIWNDTISNEIDYTEYKLLDPDFYKLDNQDDYLQTLSMDQYFYQDAWDKYGDDGANGEWLPYLIRNHLCALESQKRGLEMVEDFVEKGNTFKHVMFVRPDVFIHDRIPLYELLSLCDISIPNDNHYEGYNDRFAFVKYDKAALYGKRINEVAEFRKANGRIVSEKYTKFIITKYNLSVQLINFRFEIIRP
jgi:hypothetical protein